MATRGFTIWFTGLPFSGKKKLANMLAAKLESLGCHAEVLEGGKIRREFNRRLGYSREDVYQNIRRIGFECQMLAENGVIAIAVTISPYKKLRDEMRITLGRFIEVYCKCPLEILKKRDTSGLYKRAEEGKIADLVGITVPYEEPDKPEVVFESHLESFENGLAKLISTLRILGFIKKSRKKILTDDEEEMIRQRLKDMGYL